MKLDLKRGAFLGEMDVSDVKVLQGGRECLRLWQHKDGPIVCLMDTAIVKINPEQLGTAFAECIYEAAKMYATTGHATQQEVLLHLLKGVTSGLADLSDLHGARSGKPN